MTYFVIVTDLPKFLLIILINIPTAFRCDYHVYLLITIDNVWSLTALSSRGTVQVKIHMLGEEKRRGAGPEGAI